LSKLKEQEPRTTTTTAKDTIKLALEFLVVNRAGPQGGCFPPEQAPSGQQDGREGRATKIRVQFRLLKEIPALNLIGAVGSLDSVPLSPPGGTTGPSGK